MGDAQGHEGMFASAEPQAVRCPYPAYSHLREDHPVQWLESVGAFAVSRYDDVLAVLTRPEDFSSARMTGPGAATSLARRIAADDSYDDELRSWAARRRDIAGSAPVLVNADPPIHSRQRRLMNRTFSPRRVAELEPAIQVLVDELIDRFEPGADIDLIAEFALPLPMTVIARALGMDTVVDNLTMKRWSDSFVNANGNPALTTEQIRQLFSSMMECYDFFTEQLQERIRNPSDDLISEIAHAQLGDERLSVNEQLQICANLLVAGNETTTSLIGSAMLMLLTDHELMERLRADSSQIPAFVEEVLRVEPPVQGLFRTANVDSDVAGTAIPAGSFLWLLYASCNRDEEVFPDGDEVDLDRVLDRPHMTFGGGPHFCMGSHLARAEARIALETLLRRLPSLELAPGEKGEDWYPSLVQHGLDTLNVRVAAPS